MGRRQPIRVEAAGIPYRTFAQWYYAEADLSPGEYDIRLEGFPQARWRFILPADPRGGIRMPCLHEGKDPSYRDRLTATYPSGEILAIVSEIRITECCRSFYEGTSRPKVLVPSLSLIVPRAASVGVVFGKRKITVRSGEYVVNDGYRSRFAEGLKLPATLRIVNVIASTLARFRHEAGLRQDLGPFGFDPAPRRMTPALKGAIDQLAEAMRRPDGIGAHLAATAACQTLLLRLLQDHPNRLAPGGRVLRVPPEPPAVEPGEDPRLRRAMEYMTRHYAGPCPVEEVARESAASVSVLRRLFRAGLHQSPNDYLQGIRVRQAIRLFQAGNLTVERVAQEVGYMDVRSFRRVFRQHARKGIREFRGKS